MSVVITCTYLNNVNNCSFCSNLIQLLLQFGPITSIFIIITVYLLLLNENHSLPADVNSLSPWEALSATKENCCLWAGYENHCVKLNIQYLFLCPFQPLGCQMTPLHL